MISLLLASLLATVAVASPAPQAYALCSSVNKEIAVGASHYAATAYCSSLLRVPIYTTKATRTTTTIVTKTARKCTETFTAPEVTSTATTTATSAISTNTLSTTTTITDVLTVTETTSIYDCQVPFPTPDSKKRDVQPYRLSKPKCFSKFQNSEAVSSACSCLSIHPSTATASTKTLTITHTTTLQYKESKTTITPTKHVTSTSVATITAMTTTTFTATTSSTATTTTTINAVQPGQIFAVGAWQEGAPFNGYYLHTTGYQFTVSDPAIFSDTNEQNTSPFTLRAGNLAEIYDYYTPHFGGADPNSPYTDPQRITFAYNETSDLATGKLPCSIQVKDDFMCYLECSLGVGQSTNYVCDDGSWYIGSDSQTPPAGCLVFTPLVTDIPYQK